jgi:hypothetical protein
LREILTNEQQTDFKLEEFKEEEFLNARFQFDVLAGSHLAAKQQMAQSMVMMVQLFENPQMMQQLTLQNKKVNIEEMFHMLFDLSGYKNYYNVIQDMTPQDAQRAQQQNPAVVAAQSKGQQQQTQFQQKSQLIDQENEARAARDVLRMQIEKAERGETVQGTPGTEGLGSNEAG